MGRRPHPAGIVVLLLGGLTRGHANLPELEVAGPAPLTIAVRAARELALARRNVALSTNALGVALARRSHRGWGWRTRCCGLCCGLRCGLRCGLWLRDCRLRLCGRLLIGRLRGNRLLLRVLLLRVLLDTGRVGWLILRFAAAAAERYGGEDNERGKHKVTLSHGYSSYLAIQGHG